LELNENGSSPAEGVIRKDLAVVHWKDGSLIKGILHWHVADGEAVSLPRLPDVVHIQHLKGGISSTVRVDDVKAVFFVRTPEGNVEYEEVKFCSEIVASDLWIQVRLFDGESLEGRIENRIGLLVEPGFWLRPTDTVANNLMVYVPKSSAVEFHVMGLATSPKQRDADILTTSEKCDGVSGLQKANPV
jgi:hypothetical protein